MRMNRKSMLLAAATIVTASTLSGAAAFAEDTDPSTASASVSTTSDDPVNGSEQGCSGSTLVCSGHIKFGLSTPHALKMRASLTDLEAKIGHRSEFIGSYQDFREPIYTRQLKRAIASGRTPVVTWEPYDSRHGTRNARPLEKIAAGHYDRYLEAAAKEARSVKKPFIIRFGQEMNGFWYPWGQARPLHPQSTSPASNSPADYRNAYKHVVRVFDKYKATNVQWMWSPNVIDANPNVALRSLYPGDKVVDVIGLSGYMEQPTDTFESRYRPTMNALRTIGGSKPIVIAETGVVNSPTRATQLEDVLQAMTQEPRIAGLIYFSQPDRAIDYRIEQDAAAQRVLFDALNGTRFRQRTTSGAAFALTPTATGSPRVGQTMTATWSWRGAPTAKTGVWLSCDNADTPTENCAVIGAGSKLVVGADLHDKYVRAELRVSSKVGSDRAASPAIGPVKYTPATVKPAGVDLLSGSVRIRLPQAQSGITQWLLRLDDGDGIYLPAATTEHYFNGLTVGSHHTLSLAAADGPSKGAPTTVSFAIVTKPSLAATVAAGTGSFTATLPPPVDGQTGWIAVVDGVEEELPLATTTVTRASLSPGQHSFGIKAVAGEGRTNPTFTYFNLS